MRITVFGATGRTGRHVLEQGLRRGHKLTAFTRRPEALTDLADRADRADLADRAGLAAVVSGDGRDPAAVRRAIDGADGVIAVIAPSRRKGPHHTTEVLRAVTGSMADLGVRRLVVTDPYPVAVDEPPLAMRLLQRFLADAYADAAEMERVVTATGLDWTIVRLNRLRDKPATGRFELHRGLLDKPSGITREDAATVLLDVIADDTLARTAVNVRGG